MKHPATLITPQGEATPVDPKNGTDFQLDELKEFVGGYIEVVHPPNMPGVIMVLNEEGKLKGLAHNEIATRLWQKGAQAGSPRMADPVVGTVLLCHTSQVK
jgi:hypothetical protein